MKAITEPQPHATFIGLGVQTILTRPWATDYRGEIAVTAGKRTPTSDEIRAAGMVPAMMPILGDTWGVLLPDGDSTWLPLGVVVATCTLTDCVPIVRDPDDLPDVPALLEALPDELNYWAEGEAICRTRDLSDQRPLADFTPGRFAFLLSDPKPLPVPVPVRGRPRLWDLDDQLLEVSE